MKWYRLAAAQGHAPAQANLGSMYGLGHGVIQDYAEAARWYKLAAAQGNAAAQNNLGSMYENGQGVVQDYSEAVKWYRLAAAYELSAAQNNLGRMYAIGQGVPIDYVRAHMWFNLAAVKGTADAVRHRDQAAKQISTYELAYAQMMARKFIALSYVEKLSFDEGLSTEKRKNQREFDESNERFSAEMRRYDEKVAAEKLAEDKREDARDTANFWRGVLRGVAPQQPPPSQPPVTCSTIYHGGRTTTTCN
ncbi:MAG: Secretory immunoglobulin A-binding protein EsiB [Nitrosomonadaceae bacterium]|nr:Secretory immunoglobulin A-binding protein EsiB [Nitrosomonadaceae bacterium]